MAVCNQTVPAASADVVCGASASASSSSVLGDAYIGTTFGGGSLVAAVAGLSDGVPTVSLPPAAVSVGASDVFVSMQAEDADALDAAVNLAVVDHE